MCVSQTSAVLVIRFFGDWPIPLHTGTQGEWYFYSPMPTVPVCPLAYVSPQALALAFVFKPQSARLCATTGVEAVPGEGLALQAQVMT